MGTFNVSVRAAGDHGCEREKKGDDVIDGCGQPGCTDCITREYIQKLKASGASIEIANVTHWPGTSTQVVDDLLNKRRLGQF